MNERIFAIKLTEEEAERYIQLTDYDTRTKIKRQLQSQLRTKKEDEVEEKLIKEMCGFFHYNITGAVCAINHKDFVKWLVENFQRKEVK